MRRWIAICVNCWCLMVIYLGVFANVDWYSRSVAASVQIPILIQNAELRAKIPNDPWGRPYIYQRRKYGLEILTLGRDGKAGGDGEDSDISSTRAGWMAPNEGLFALPGVLFFGSAGVLAGYWLARALIPLRNLPVRNPHERA